MLKLCAAVSLAAASVSAVAGAGNGNVVPGSMETDRIIVKYKDSMPADAAKGLARAAAMSGDRKAKLDRAGQQFGMTVSESHTISTGAHVFKLNGKRGLKDVQALAAEMMARDPNIEYAEPDRIMTHMATANDPLYTQQWHYTDATGGLRLPTAWDKSTGTGVVVAVIDTGYRPHADLSGQFLQGYDFIRDTFIANDGNGRDSDASDPGDAIAIGECGNGQPTQNRTSSWHGTHVAGTIAARTNNGTGVAGVAYNAKIVPARVLGKCGGYTSDIADAITWTSGGSVTGVPANANKAKVLNLSLGGSGACDSTTQTAINGARSRGAVVVVAAGNSAMNVSNSNPANCAGVIAVAATGKTGGRASYSNYGTLIDVAAPGGDGGYPVISTLNSGTGAPASDNYAGYQGTSMATPHVAGTAALMLAVNPALTPDGIESKLKSSARAFPVACSGCGAGIVDATAAVAAAQGASVGTAMAETEGNNMMSTANQVTASGSTVTGYIGNGADTDYFRVDLPAGKTLSSYLAPNSTANYNLYVYNSAGALMGQSVNGIGMTDTVHSANTGTTTSIRYVRVVYYTGTTGAATSGGKYTLKLTW
ncbi:S8 family peptidase [Massilia sp. ZL223]|uniref:S8 family peptidase n=1 Tax=Massilia sp. ZL223 TaxID=2824904 RepID=UPI001B8109F0|nr:S8 family peptidase [Massilia sp. ZL223]MBQ5963767.1 S8 family serine peptidase [Massilia sp. ZL223]